MFLELQNLRKKYDAVVEYTVHVSAEKEVLAAELESVKKELKTARKKNAASSGGVVESSSNNQNNVKSDKKAAEKVFFFYDFFFIFFFLILLQSFTVHTYL
jgi:hypothetical protein